MQSSRLRKKQRNVESPWTVQSCEFLGFKNGKPMVSLPGSRTESQPCEVTAAVAASGTGHWVPGRTRVLVAAGSNDGAPVIFAVVVENCELLSPETRSGNSLPEAIVDDERLVLEAKREVVLRCGDSEIVLRSDGKVTIRGRDITTRAARSNRIKGANVMIN